MVKRLGPVQFAVVALVDRGVREFEKLVQLLSTLNIPKSSIYTAVEELRRRGLVRVVEESGKRVLVPVKPAREVLEESMKPLILQLVRSLLLVSAVTTPEDYRGLGVELLSTLRELLARELDKVEKALGDWRRVPVE